MLASGFGLGFIPIMPGTFGSLLGPVWVWAIQESGLIWTVYAVICVAVVWIGLPVCTRAGRLLHATDPGTIVYDEIAAFPLVLAPMQLAGTEVGWLTGILGFAWFRLFDIAKPWPIKRFERLPGAWGVMADDLVAGVFAGLALWGTVAWVVPLLE